MDFVDRLRSAILRAGAFDDVVRMSGVPKITLLAFLAGNDDVTFRCASAIATACKVSLDWLAYGDRKMFGPPPIDTAALTDEIIAVYFGNNAGGELTHERIKRCLDEALSGHGAVATPSTVAEVPADSQAPERPPCFEIWAAGQIPVERREFFLGTLILMAMRQPNQDAEIGSFIRGFFSALCDAKSIFAASKGQA